MIPRQFSLGEDPSKTLGGDGLKFSVDRRGEMTIFPGKAETEDLLQIHKTTDDFFPLFVIDRLYQAAPVLSLIQSASGVVKDNLSGRRASQDLSPFIGRIHSMKNPIVSPGES